MVQLQSGNLGRWRGSRYPTSEMSKAALDGERRVQTYLASFGLRNERFTKTEKRRGKTPDFRVFAGEQLAFYCEVKTAQEDDWLDRQLATALPLTPVGGSRPDPTYNRINKYVSSAVGQFDAVNPSMDYPNVLAIVNGDDRAGFTDLIQVLTGNAYCESGEVIPLFREYSEGRIRESKFRVHLYLWFNEWQDREPWKFFSGVHPVHHAALCSHFSVDPIGLKHLSSAQ